MINKVNKLFAPVNSPETIANLKKALDATNPTAPITGFWAVCSAEVIDSSGDIISIDGITYTRQNPPDSYTPICASHNLDLPNGEPSSIGRVEAFIKSTLPINGVDTPILAMYFTFALDADGKPLDELVEKYYKRYTTGYGNAFSIAGMGKFSNTKTGKAYSALDIYEVSAVTVGDNKYALLMKSIGEGTDNSEDPTMQDMMDLLCSMNDCVKGLCESHNGLCEQHNETNTIVKEMKEEMKGLCKKEFDPFIERLDTLEATLTKHFSPVTPVKSNDSKDIEMLTKMLDKKLKGNK